MDDEKLSTWLTVCASMAENLSVLLKRETFKDELLAADPSDAESVLRGMVAGFRDQFDALGLIPTLYTLHPEGRRLRVPPHILRQLLGGDDA